MLDSTVKFNSYAKEREGNIEAEGEKENGARRARRLWEIQ